MNNNIKYLILHHSASSKSTKIEQVSNWHKNRNWGTASSPIYAKKSSLGSYCQYHYFLDDKGWSKGRKESEVGWHCGDRIINNSSISICIAGNYEKERINKKTLELLRIKILYLKKKYNIPNSKIVGHRDIKPTACPGKNLIGYIRNDYWDKKPHQTSTVATQCRKEKKTIITLKKEKKCLEVTIKGMERKQGNIQKESKEWEKKARKRREIVLEQNEIIKNNELEMIEKNKEIKGLEMIIQKLEKQIRPEGRVIFEFGEYIIFHKKVE